MPYICVIDTLCQGMVASWRDEDEKPVIFETEEEAIEEANDVMDGDDSDLVIAVTVTPTHIIGIEDGRVYWTLGEKSI